MAKLKLTIGRVTGFKCPDDAAQAFLWCDEVPGLAVRATPGSSRNRYVFQSKVNKQTRRITIGDVSIWSITEAKIEARRLQTIIDQGNDPREVKAEQCAAKIAAAAAKKAQETRETLIISTAWNEYIEDRKPFWGARHYHDHIEVMHQGGEERARSNRLTEPGVLASLATVRLIDLTPDRVTQWAKIEGIKRAGRARFATRLLSGFLNWCGEHERYKTIINGNPAKNKKVREQLGEPEILNDVLQKEQLPAWFSAIKQLRNPIISAYLQTLLLTGRRPNELTSLRWEDVDFKWESMTVGDKVEGLQVIPLPPYLAYLMGSLPRRNQFVFYSPAAAGGHIVEPHDAFKKACAKAGIEMTVYGLRRSFATLSEWIDTPGGIAAQIQGHKPSGVRERHYIRRPLDLLRMWHVKIEQWILEQAGIEFESVQASLRVVKS